MYFLDYFNKLKIPRLGVLCIQIQQINILKRSKMIYFRLFMDGWFEFCTFLSFLFHIFLQQYFRYILTLKHSNSYSYLSFELKISIYLFTFFQLKIWIKKYSGNVFRKYCRKCFLTSIHTICINVQKRRGRGSLRDTFWLLRSDIGKLKMQCLTQR